MHIRKARFAGSWYTNDPASLRAEVDEFSDLVQKVIWKPISQEHEDTTAHEKRNVKGGVLPHAGLSFSGRGIAHFFHFLGNETTRIIIIAPSHYTPLPPDTLFCSSHDSFETPLGDVPAVKLLDHDEKKILRKHDQAVEMEHAVEMFLPFIARAREVSQQPLNVGVILLSEISGTKQLRNISDDLLQLIGKDELAEGRTVLIASSDFTHYGPRFGYIPFGIDNVKEIENQVQQQDLHIAEQFCSCQFEQLMDIKKHKDLTICGFAPGLAVSSVMEKINAQGQVMDYYNSNHFLGPDIGFVAYCTLLWR